MPFLTEADPERGVALECLSGIRRIAARNPSVMTYFGTNTYLIGGPEGLTILDPGPDDPIHVRDIIAAAADRPILNIVLTHTHRDHAGAASALQGMTGAKIYAFHRSAAAHFAPDHGLAEGGEIAGLVALHTPGHASDHLCFAYHVPGTGPILFSGDHVMSWSSSIVNPPDGDMKAYYQNLSRLLDRDEAVYLPGHGPLLREPKPLIREMLAHRRSREAAILEAIRNAPAAIGPIAAALYAKQDPWLKIAAERNVLAHLLKLETEGLAVQRDAVWLAAVPNLAENHEEA